jgi:F0F1-type ATP synthase membrane subunit a
MELPKELPKKYFHDRTVLLMLSINTFLALLNVVAIFLRLDSTSGSYIVQYRANQGLSAYTAGDSSTLIGFALFGLIILLFQTFMSIKAYKFHRPYAVSILVLSSLLLLLSIIVSNALLALR